MSYAKPWGRETPLRNEDYAGLVDEYLAADDPHHRYLMDSLVRWHVPTPWRNWSAFRHGTSQGGLRDDR